MKSVAVDYDPFTAESAPSHTPVPGNLYGLRNDGTPKGEGYLGMIPMADGQRHMTEMSMGVEYDGKETEIPAIVPTLTPDELDYLKQGGNPLQNESIQRKADEHARMRISQGKSPFATASERIAPKAVPVDYNPFPDDPYTEAEARLRKKMDAEAGSLIGNAFKLAGQRVADIVGGGFETAEQAAKGTGLDQASISGLAFDESGTLDKLAIERAQAGLPYSNSDRVKLGDTLGKAAQASRDFDLGAQSKESLDNVFESIYNDRGFVETINRVGRLVVEQGIQSAPDMLAAALNLPGYMLARAGELAQERAEANGRKEPTIDDFRAGAATAMAVSALERFGVEAILAPVKEGVGTVKGAIEGLVKGAVGEAGTEAPQEALEYVATAKDGTATWAGARDAALAGAIGGAGVGAALGGAHGAYEGWTGGSPLQEDRKPGPNIGDLPAVDDLIGEAVEGVPPAGPPPTYGADGIDAAEVTPETVELAPAPRSAAGVEAAAELQDALEQSRNTPRANIELSDTDVIPTELAPPIPEEPPSKNIDVRSPTITHIDAAPAPAEETLTKPPVPGIDTAAIEAIETIDDKPVAEAVAATKQPLKPSATFDLQKARNQQKSAYQKQREINTATDDLLVAVAKLGGISRTEAEAQGIDPAEFGRYGWKIHRVFSTEGKSMDGMAEMLSQHGYPVVDEQGNYDANIMLSALSDALAGRRVATFEGMEADMEREAIQRAEDGAYEAKQDDWAYDELDSPSQQFMLDVAESARQNGVPEADISRILDHATVNGYSNEEVIRILIEEIEAVQPGRTGREPAVQKEQQAPVLSSYSAADLEARDAEVKAAQTAREKAEKKAQADDQRKSFTLSGSDTEADQAAAAGQEDLLSQPVTPIAKKFQTKTNEVYDRGDKGRYTGKTETVAGAEFHEIVMLEGHDKGKTRLIKRPPPADGPIEDFGETLLGARKHYAEALKDAQEYDIATESLAKVWPEPNYQNMIKEGADPWLVGFIRAARDEIPSRPRNPYKLRRYVSQVEMLRKFASDLLSGEISQSVLKEKLAEKEFQNLRDSVGGRADLYVAVGHDVSLKGIGLHVGEYSMLNGVKYDPAKVIWTVSKKAKKTAFSNWPTELSTGSTRAEAIENFKKRVQSGDLDTAKSKDRSVRFDVYSKRSEKGVIYVGKKIGKDYFDLKTFPDVKEARAYLQDHHDDLMAMLDKIKNVPSERRDTNSPRVGIDHRDGVDVTPEMFSEAFGFRGVQFGNYVEGSKRQTDLNEAYDALMDLAGVLGIPARALSLNGELGLAFGARGKGGRSAGGSAPAAHYEPGNIVINLTKNSGAGSLAHEWFHSLDNYFSRMGGDKEGYATENLQLPGVRPEMIAAFKNVRDTVNKSAVQTRSKKLDRARTKAYWSTGIEMAARSFESYIIEKLRDEGASNDYLANIVSAEYWKAATALGMEQDDTYPYPEAAEIPAIRAAFDAFFKTIESRETDKGVGLFAAKREPWKPDPNDDPVIAGLKLLANNEDLYQYKASEAEELEDITAEVAPGWTARDLTETYVGPGDDARRMWSIETDDGTAYIFENKDDTVYINVGGLAEGKSRGSVIYAIVANYAFNNDLVFVGDPQGLTAAAKIRRTEHLLSSAMKFGTTRHIAPDKSQNIPWKTGDDVANFRALLEASRANIIKNFPEAADLVYNFETQQIENAKNGKRVGQADLQLAASTAGGTRQARAGRRTLTRAALYAGLVSRKGQAARDELLAKHAVERGAGGLDAALELAFYAKTNQARPSAGLLVSRVREYLESKLGKAAVKRLIDSGKFRIASLSDKGIPTAVQRAARNGDTVYGYYQPKTDATPETSWLFADNLTDTGGPVDGLEDAYGIFLHEVGTHYGMRGMLGDKLFGEVIAKTNAAIDAKVDTAFTRAVRTARENVPHGTPQSQIAEETLAWLITDAANHQLSLVRRIIAKIRAFLIARLKITRAVSTDALVELARGAAMRAGNPKGDTGLFASAYHGTPHRFDRFDSSKIGTGEGAQAYGHGLYFAENPKVAEQYKSETSYTDIVRKWRDELPDDAEFSEVQEMAESGAFGEKAKPYFKALADNDWLGFDYPSQAISASVRKGAAERYDMSQELVDAIADLGNIYKVDIPDESIDKMLDWDAPMSEQPDAVRKAATNILARKPAHGKGIPVPDKEAGTIYLRASDDMTGHQLLQMGVTEEELKTAGIPGIKYYDGGSRARPDYGDSLKDFIEKHGGLAQAKAEAKKRHDKAVVEHGIGSATARGFQRFLQELHAGNKTRNFVVFDDSIVTIIDRNGEKLAGDAKTDAIEELQEQHPETASEGNFARRAAGDIRKALDPVIGDSKQSLKARAKSIIDWLDSKTHPLSTLQDRTEYLKQRYLTLGRIAETQQAARAIYDTFRGVSEADGIAIYDYLTDTEGTVESISTTSLRTQAKRVKIMIDTTGRALVERGVIPQESFEKYEGRYLPRIYLAYLLGDRAVAQVGTGKKLSEQGYAKKRNDELPQEYRDVILGEIKDPAFLASRAIGIPLRDLAILNWLSQIAENPEWALPKQTVQWTMPGFDKPRKVTPYWLKSEASKLRERAEYYKGQNKADALRVAGEMDILADATLAEAGLQGDAVPDGYGKVPNSARYGAIRGLVVRQEIYDDIVGVGRIMADNASLPERLLGYGGVGTKVTQIFKWSKVAANPPAQVRNLVSNWVLLNLSGVPLRKIPRLFVRAIREIRTNGDYYKIGKKYGITESTFAAQELFRIEREVTDMMKRQRDGWSLADLKHIAAMVMDTTGDIYQAAEMAGKLMKIMDAMEREGKTEFDAALEAQEWLFDYSLVGRKTRYLRNAPIGFPFLTFTIKVLPRLIDVALTAPWRFLPYYGMFWAAQQLVMAMTGADDDDMKALEKALPDFIREKGHAMVLPVKDEHGRWQFVDLGYFMPWTPWTEFGTKLTRQAKSLATTGEIDDLASIMTLNGLFGGPIPDLLAAMQTNIDPFTKREIVDEDATAGEQMAARLTYLYGMMMPTWLVGIPPFHDQSTYRGAGGHLYEALTGATDRYGEPRSTIGQALARFVGMNIYAVEPAESRSRTIKYMNYKISDVERRRNKVAKDRSLSKEKRADLRKEYNEKLKRMRKKKNDYAQESRIPANLR